MDVQKENNSINFDGNESMQEYNEIRLEKVVFLVPIVFFFAFAITNLASIYTTLSLLCAMICANTIATKEKVVPAVLAMLIFIAFAFIIK